MALPEMRQGKIALCFATLLAGCSGHRTVPHMDYPTPEHAHAIARGQLAYYRALEKAGGKSTVTSNYPTINWS